MEVSQDHYVVTPRKRMGCSPFFAATGAHPLLLFDVVEANYLLPPPESLLATTDLIVRRAIALQKRQGDLAKLRAKVHEQRNQAAIRFERDHSTTIRNYDFKRGSLILICNTAIEKALNRKMQPRYFGPMVVVSRNKGGTYIICELDGTLMHNPVAAFRAVPYFARDYIEIPDLERHLNVSVERLRELEASSAADPNDHYHAKRAAKSQIYLNQNQTRTTNRIGKRQNQFGCVDSRTAYLPGYNCSWF
jgi:hypothetical protein